MTGAAGMLGGDVRRAAQRAGYELALADVGAAADAGGLPELDITDAAAVDELLDRLGGDPGSLHGIVNCAAWTDVDGAETKREQAHAVNATGAGILARAAAEIA